MDNQQIYDVIVIGAGAAGIGAVATLSKQNISYIVLQARDRIGGRVVSKNIDGVYVDLGASWIHSYTEDNPLYKYVNNFKIKQLNCDRKMNQIIIDIQQGKQLQKQIIIEGQQKYEELLIYIKQIAKKQQFDKSVYNIVTKYMEQNFNKYSYKLQKYIKSKLSQIQCYQASNIEQMSAKYFDFQFGQDIDYIPEGSYGQLLKKISNLYNMKVQLNKIVKQIYYNKQNIKVICQDGYIYRCKKIISSLPLGILKQKNIKFFPQLPIQYKQSIQRLFFGLMNKIIIQFQNKFWEDKSWILIISNQEIGEFIHIYNISQSNKNILCCFLTGYTAKKYQYKNDQDILQEFISILSNVFGNQNVKIKSYTITRWGQDQFSKGSYTSFQVDSSPDDCYQLRKSINQTLWMVGEHCWAEKMGTAHGAFKTGQIAAQEVIISLQADKKSKDKILL